MEYVEKKQWVTVPRVILGSIVIFLLTTLIAGRIELANTAKLAKDVLDTLKNQCSGYERLLAADRTKSLFRLTDMMRNFSSYMLEMEEAVTDEYLEQYVDSMRLSGIAVLDENLRLQASGYTRQFRNADWVDTLEGNRFADIIDHPAKVFAERVEVNGKYYDICAVARRDEPGIVIGYYQQPTGMITDTEDDLESLLTGLKLEREGNYIITQENVVRAGSESGIKNETFTNSEILRKLSGLKKDEKLHVFQIDNHFYWGYRDGYDTYRLFVYYPLLAPFSSSLMTGVIAVAVYAVLFLLLYAVRNRTLLQNQKSLQQSNDDLTETVKMLKALETIYFSLFRVDLVNDSYDTISVSRYLEDKISRNGSYTELRKMFVETMVEPAFREEVDGRMSVEAIRKALNKDNITDVRKSFYMDFRADREGEVRWCRVSATVVNADETGRPVHVLVLLQDVDKEKTKEAEYQARILEESYKARMANNAKTEFLRRISHDIRTPLNGIQGYIEMGSRDPQNETLQEYCREKATFALNTLFQLVNSVLEMSDMEGHEIQLEEVPFDLDLLLREVDTVVKPQAIAKNISCKILQDARLPVSNLIGSPRHVTQILMNLASNGIKFGKQDGFLRLDVKPVLQTENRITYEFCLRDNGIGMSEEFQKHMYEPFEQEAVSARSTYEGTGLGLAIVRKLVDALGGTITVDSEKDVGTEFKVQLTFQRDKSIGEPDKKEPGGGVLCLQDMHVLLVEDNELNMEIAEFFFMNFGAKVTKAWNGKEAVDLFRESEAGEFDVVFMDIMMPVMNGLEACRAIRELNRADAKSIPIAAMSANALEEDIKRSRDAGMNAHIGKPINERKLLETIFKLLYG